MTGRPSVRAVLPGQAGPVYCVWELTLRCDLACRHCGSRAGKARPGELDTDACLDIVRQLAEVGVKDVALIGGEAYLRDDWTTIIRAIRAHGMVARMVTGARGLDAERVRAAADAGLQAVSISIDGLEATHDRVRHLAGSWRAAVEAARRVAASPIRLAANTQLNRLSAPELEAIAALLVELGARVWQVQLTVPMGRAADWPELILQPYELLELYPRLAAVAESVLRPAGIQLAPANNIGYFGPLERVLRLGGADGVHWQGCPAGAHALGIEADGSLKGCPSLPSAAYIGGNLRATPLAELLRTAPLRRLADRTADDLWGFCRTCYYADVCKGGCSWTAHSALGRPGNNPWCHHRALELAAQGLRERVVPVEPAPGTPFDHGRMELVVEPS